MGTSLRLEPESPLAHLDDEALIRRYCTARATKTTDEEASQELWRRHEPILRQKIKYIAGKPGDVRHVTGHRRRAECCCARTKPASSRFTIERLAFHELPLPSTERS